MEPDASCSHNAVYIIPSNYRTSVCDIVENGFVQRPILLSTVTVVHTILAGTALTTGIWITGSWHLQTSIANCIKKSYIMRYLIITWILALIFGITLYLRNHINFI